MRIISGNFGGRKLKAVPGRATRPTTDKVKESIFNMIGPYFAGGNCLDLFSGSGALGIEAVSRGMASATLVDRQFAAIKVIHENIELTKAEKQFTVLKMSAQNALQKLAGQHCKFNLILLDPPYAKQQITSDLREMAELGLIENEAVIVCETDSTTVLPEKLTNFKQTRRQTYGLTAVTLYHYQEAAEV
ncbi:16S rRNA (guanine(966)-N(2))-methyltransferase RsmD [Loigolactobacillus backii]|uniref:16S rRNA (Guanine(966)-N(2))-methyltransferase RsmD n=1 Tax=Loigolactobacillus backii TaxID=375175 RepID=A0A192H2S2_9LACO|nr:16S rRNA (guanine(966)-N(2))-methyltransferase RsmD [Loigolactobacillus backii]ANK63109.1 16S rRNA (guanine(966)-N(2))-methyltransferase RsmD [Loigolactobacillus backii]ANK69883.1 16S rRNA (guanine(966)-N(2))-methyltransferase RsmD [Loigolactobacillus backii]MDA5387112.1 16S rRNA (guanine(966)-N(2))-methyltransferase RsmD [Loigolactobacillus backii]MDA5389665.1 16S rRNA (guanine(966)-N(2))-methyltransferase RsmD [Loigolactobacillus backii]PIO83639.1 16S rRNA (guanine(966)-N(2))-methyltransf